MRNLKKALSLALALVMLLGMMVMGASAATFADVPEGVAKQPAIEVMNTIDIIKGDGTGEFRPNDTLTRAEAAVIISKVLMTPSIVEKIAQNTVTSKFADVNAYDGGWAAPYVEACVAAQVILGNDDGTFAPANEVSGVEFAAMLLRVLDIDKGQFVNWPFDWQKAALDAGLDANDADVFAEKLTRQDAAQMALNALVYSPNGERTDFVVTAKDEAGKTVTLYSGTNETAAYLIYTQAKDNEVAAGGTDKYEADSVKINEESTTVGSWGERQFGLTRVKSTDELGRTAVTYTAPKYKLNLTVAEPADYIFVGKVTNRTVYNTVGKDVATNYTWNVKVDGVAQESNLKPTTGNTAYQATEAGAYTEIYLKDNEVNVFISYYRIAAVSKVVPAKNGEARYVMIDGKRYETEQFAAKDIVVYTVNGNDIDKVIPAPEYTAVLTKIVNDVTFTLLDDGDRVCGKYHDGVSLSKGDLGKEIVFYVDPMGNIMKVKDADPAAAPTNRLWVVANSSARENPDYITSTNYPYSYMAYGIKDDGTVEEWNIVEINGKKILPVGSRDENNAVITVETNIGVVANNDGKHYGMYRYSKVGNSLKLTTDENAAIEDIQVNKPGVTYTGGKTALANSKTTFVFFEEKSATDHTIVKNSVHHGIADIGTDIEAKTKGTVTGVVVDTKNTVQVVFVKRAWNDGSTAPDPDEAGVAYLIAGTEKKIDWLLDNGGKETRYEYTAVDGTGDVVTIVNRSRLSVDGTVPYGGSVYSFDADYQMIAALADEERQWTEAQVEYIRTDAVKLGDIDHSFNITENTTVVDAIDGGYRELVAGDTVIMVTEAGTTKPEHWNAQVVFVTQPAAEGTESVTPTGTSKGTGTSSDPYKLPGLVDTGMPITINGVGAPASQNKSYIVFGDSTTKIEVRYTGSINTLEGGAAFAWNDANVNPSDVMGFYYENATGAAVSNVVLKIKDSNGVVKYAETAASIGNGAGELFLVNVVNTKVGQTTVWNSAAGTTNTKTGSLAGEGTELAEGWYTWEITVNGAHHSGGRFEIDNNGR